MLHKSNCSGAVYQIGANLTLLPDALICPTSRHSSCHIPSANPHSWWGPFPSFPSTCGWAWGFSSPFFSCSILRSTLKTSLKGKFNLLAPARNKKWGGDCGGVAAVMRRAKGDRSRPQPQRKMVFSRTRRLCNSGLNFEQRDIHATFWSLSSLICISFDCVKTQYE